MIKLYAGLDVSEATTSICVVDEDVIFETAVATDPAEIARALKPFLRKLAIVVQETGSLAVWLQRELTRRRVPIQCFDARIVRAALAAQRNKTDRNDARDIALLAARGFAAPVYVKSEDAHAARLLLTCRRNLKRKAHDLHMVQVKSIKLFGPASAKPGQRASTRPPLVDAALAGLERARASMLEEIDRLDRIIQQTTAKDAVCRRFMTVPGVGPLTALAFKATIDDPTRFAGSRTVGAYLGLTPKRVQSGKSDYQGRISKLGDQHMRTALYEAAMVMLVRSKTPSRLRQWGLKLAQKHGLKFAAAACARKLAALLHRLWLSGEDFDPERGMRK